MHASRELLEIKGRNIMRTEISTLEISERFGKMHRDVSDGIKAAVSKYSSPELLFNKSTYENSRGRTYNCHTMGVDGFCILTDTRGYSRGASAHIKAEILSEFGMDFSVCGSAIPTSEDGFYEMLKSFLSKEVVTRQYPIGKFKVDFYLEERGLFIEFDEAHHKSETHKKADKERWNEIKEHVRLKTGHPAKVVRVNLGEEIEGLAKIAGYIAFIDYGQNDFVSYYYDSPEMLINEDELMIGQLGVSK